MKKYFKWMSIATMLCLGTGVFAQQKSISQQIEDKNGKLKIHIETTEGGKKEVFDKEYDTKGLSDADKEKLISRITDSLSANASEGKQTRYRIKIDTDKNIEEKVELGKKPQKRFRAEIHRNGGPMPMDSLIDAHTDIEIFRQGVSPNEIFAKIQPRFEMFNDNQNFVFIDKSKESKTIRGLKIYPNKPFDSKLNLHFNAPEKGDVSIRVTDVEGNEVATQKIKAFEGEFMGQVELKKSAKGTLFVTVTQKNDGSVQRIVIE